MSRWEPNARGRLEQAALELFGERGYDQTTIADIAERAGVTKRTYFRHFPDKREVLFGGGEAFRQLFLDGLEAAPASAGPMEAVAAALQQVAGSLAARRDAVRRRQAVIAAHAELQERELVKLVSVAAALAAGLRERGVPEPTASVTAETAVAVFRVSFERWVTSSSGELTQIVTEALDSLRTVTAGP